MVAFVIAVSFLSLAFAVYLARWVLARDTGTPKMREISDAIKEGAEAFLSRQNRTIILMSAILAAVIFFLYAYVRAPSPADPVSPLQMAFWTTFSFVLGALCSVIAGYVGMWVSIRANIRTASAVRGSLNEGLRIAMRGGAVSGLFVVAMSLLGVGGLYALLEFLGHDPQKIPFTIVGYGFGASFVALFAQLGGGIYTKAADVGADLVGKVEAGIPEDDPRNPAVIADLVGDNVGDCAGRGADLFESTAAENIGAMILGVLLYPYFGIGGIFFPLVIGAFGLIASIIGVMMVRTSENLSDDPMKALNRGYYIVAALVLVALYFSTRWLLDGSTPAPGVTPAPDAWWHFFLCGVIGFATAIAFVYITEYYTEYRYRPVLGIADASRTGPATNIIAGLAVGMESTVLPVLTISAALLGAYFLGRTSGLVNEAGDPVGGLFGTAVAAVGMLGTAGYILAMDVFGPITDNAGGVAEMSRQPESVRDRTDRLDSVGNTTKALTKGYAIGSAALAAFLLFSAYLAEVRRQFAERPGIMLGTEMPDYGRCVDIVTIGALKAMVFPGALVVLFPIVVGLVFRQFGVGAEAVAAFLMVGTIGGILMAGFLNNGGGAWDNAKKYIESGAHGGKGSDAHKAAVVGDTVGDPFKDTSGPSLNILIKLMSVVSLVFASTFGAGLF